jgi:hypothetical protein
VAHIFKQDWLKHRITYIRLAALTERDERQVPYMKAKS